MFKEKESPREIGRLASAQNWLSWSYGFWLRNITAEFVWCEGVRALLQSSRSSWIWSVPGAIATWSNHRIQESSGISHANHTGSLSLPVLTRSKCVPYKVCLSLESASPAGLAAHGEVVFFGGTSTTVSTNSSQLYLIKTARKGMGRQFYWNRVAYSVKLMNRDRLVVTNAVDDHLVRRKTFFLRPKQT